MKDVESGLSYRIGSYRALPVLFGLFAACGGNRSSGIPDLASTDVVAPEIGTNLPDAPVSDLPEDRNAGLLDNAVLPQDLREIPLHPDVAFDDATDLLPLDTATDPFLDLDAPEEHGFPSDPQPDLASVESADSGPPPEPDVEPDPGADPCQDGAPEDVFHGEADSSTGLPPCPMGVMEEFTESAISPPTAGSGAYQPPSADAMAAFSASITALLSNDSSSAAGHALAAGYLLCHGEGAEADLVLWRPIDPTSGHARLAFRIAGARPLIVEAPHAFFDMTTETEAGIVFRTVPGRVLLVNGAHRCASDVPSGCDGSSTVCGVAAPYAVSDMAHTEVSFFHVAHRVFAEAFGTDRIVQLHGMKDIGASVSDTSLSSLPPGSAAELVGQALMASFPQEKITSCDAWLGAVVEFRLCGQWNVQGRHVNGSPAPCTVAATSSAGRFVHLEQSPVLRQYPEVVAAAVSAGLWDTSTGE